MKREARRRLNCGQAELILIFSAAACRLDPTWQLCSLVGSTSAEDRSSLLFSPPPSSPGVRLGRSLLHSVADLPSIFRRDPQRCRQVHHFPLWLRLLACSHRLGPCCRLLVSRFFEGLGRSSTNAMLTAFCLQHHQEGQHRRYAALQLGSEWPLLVQEGMELARGRHHHRRPTSLPSGFCSSAWQHLRQSDGKEALLHLVSTSAPVASLLSSSSRRR